MTVQTDSPRIYIASLSDYNAGRLVGEWFDLAQYDESDLSDAIQAMLARADARYPGEWDREEWAIHDYEGFEGFPLGENTDLETVCAVADAISEHGRAFALRAADVGLECALECFEDSYLGQWDSFEDYVCGYIEDSGMFAGLFDTIANYFDYQSFARDLRMDLSVYEVGYNEVHIFTDY